MAYAGALVGAILVPSVEFTAAAIPASLQAVATQVLVPAANWLINPIMPIVFWTAAMDAGKRPGLWATVLGGIRSHDYGQCRAGACSGDTGRQRLGRQRLETA